MEKHTTSCLSHWMQLKFLYRRHRTIWELCRVNGGRWIVKWKQKLKYNQSVNSLYFFLWYCLSWIQRHHKILNCTVHTDRMNSKKSPAVFNPMTRNDITYRDRVEKKSPIAFIFLSLWFQPPDKLQPLRWKVTVMVTAMIARQETKILRKGTPFLWAKDCVPKNVGVNSVFFSLFLPMA